MPDLDMSPYGPFVWGAYAASLGTLLALVAIILRRAQMTSRRLIELDTHP